MNDLDGLVELFTNDLNLIDLRILRCENPQFHNRNWVNAARDVKFLRYPVILMSLRDFGQKI